MEGNINLYTVHLTLWYGSRIVKSPKNMLKISKLFLYMNDYRANKL